MKEEMAFSAKMNFENLERVAPIVKKHPLYVIAKAQLDEALGGASAHEVIEKHLGPPTLLGEAKLKENGEWETSGLIESVTESR